jgi:flagellar basal body-associated protein FliL
MDNIFIIALNIVVVLCFITFFISTFRVFESAGKKENPNSEKRGIISRFLAYLQSLVND